MGRIEEISAEVVIFTMSLSDIPLYALQKIDHGENSGIPET